MNEKHDFLVFCCKNFQSKRKLTFIFESLLSVFLSPGLMTVSQYISLLSSARYLSLLSPESRALFTVSTEQHSGQCAPEVPL